MGKRFNPGDFRHRIVFLKCPDTRDSYGEVSGDWLPFKHAYAKKEPILGKELYTAITTDSKIEIKFKLRYIPNITDEMQIQSGNVTYEIISLIDVDDAHKELLCYCKQLDKEE